jgi:hypothetical protein
MSAERITADAEELTGWLRSRLVADRVVVLGYRGARRSRRRL